MPPAATEHVPDDTLPRKTLAWSVHLFTATGAVWGILAIRAVFFELWQEAFLWLALAVFVDGIDGTFARIFRVKQVLPDFDGTLLDNVIDYLNYVVVPALIVYFGGLVPEGMALAAAAAMALSSAYQFCQTTAKTPDNYFRGFPSYWNVVVFYLIVCNLKPVANVAIIAVLVLLVFIPIKYVYPSRTAPFQRTTLLLTGIWGAMILAAVFRLDDPSPWLIWPSLLYVVYYVALSLYLHVTTAGDELLAEPAPDH